MSRRQSVKPGEWEGAGDWSSLGLPGRALSSHPHAFLLQQHRSLCSDGSSRGPRPSLESRDLLNLPWFVASWEVLSGSPKAVLIPGALWGEDGLQGVRGLGVKNLHFYLH